MSQLLLTDIREKIELKDGTTATVDIGLSHAGSATKNEICEAIKALFSDIIKKFEA